jgi:hypothetical protein
MPTWQAAYARSLTLREDAEAAQALADASPGDEELAAAAEAAWVAYRKEAALALNRKTRGALVNERRPR